ncbi:hypothetical protein DFH06DRAFT_1386392 [Mycena polygramma]|nr:hypothetical protein DFH06DRAFT_1386392 [Mycena polygramma]
MPGIRWLLAALRRFVLGNPLVRASIRGLLFLFSALSRATKDPDAASNLTDKSQNIHAVHPEAPDALPANPERQVENRIAYTSASFIPASVHPYPHSGPSASRSSQDITAHPTAQESCSPHSLSVQHLPATLSIQHPPTVATLSVQHLPALPPSPYLAPGHFTSVIDFPPQEFDSETDGTCSLRSLSVQDLPATSSVQHPPAAAALSVQHLPALPPGLNLGSGCLPSTNSSVIDFQPDTGSPSQSRRSSGGFGDITVPSPSRLDEVHARIFPGTPESVRRYDRKAFVPDELTQFVLPPLTISLDPNPPPPGWTVCLHPEGARYFFHEEKRVSTDANIFDPSMLKFITDNMRIIADFLCAQGIQFAPDVDLVLDEYIYDDGSKGCQYYYVNHLGRCVFWLDRAQSHSMFSISTQLNGVSSASLIRNELEAQYWNHCELFPRSFVVTPEIIDELRDIVLHALGDVVTSSTSTVSWTIGDLNNMIKLIDGFDKNLDKNINNKFSGASCIVGRLMHGFAKTRVYNFHGEPSVRLKVNQSVYDTVRKRTLLIKLLCPLLFYAPDFHLAGLQTIYIDGLVRRRVWSDFIKQVTNDWQNFHTLYATVLLNVNVAFLAIQSVDNNSVTSPSRSPTQIASYLSILMSMGSIIVGLLLVEKNRNARDFATAPDTLSFTAGSDRHRLETLAILYSLPYAMLVWSILCFLAAFFFMCFESSTLITRILVAVLWTAVAAFIVWCIRTLWEGGGWDGLLVSGRRPAPDEGDGAQRPEDSKLRKWWWTWTCLSKRTGDEPV